MVTDDGETQQVSKFPLQLVVGCDFIDAPGHESSL